MADDRFAQHCGMPPLIRRAAEHVAEKNPRWAKARCILAAVAAVRCAAAPEDVTLARGHEPRPHIRSTARAALAEWERLKTTISQRRIVAAARPARGTFTIDLAAAGALAFRYKHGWVLVNPAIPSRGRRGGGLARRHGHRSGTVTPGNFERTSAGVRFVPDRSRGPVTPTVAAPLPDALARVAPGGRLPDDLTGFSDDELGAAYSHLQPDAAVRVLAEMDRRDTDTRMPDIDPSFVGMSDQQLADRARTADGPEFDAILAEADRRDRYRTIFPGGQLTGDLTTLSDDDLEWSARYVGPADVERLAAELDRRDPVSLPAASGGSTAQDTLADQAAVDDALGPLVDARPTDDDMWGQRWADDIPDDVRDRMTPAERWAYDQEYAERQARADSARRARELYDVHVAQQYLAAEEFTRGHMLTPQAEARGVDPASLFSGPAHVARANASEDLLRFWSEQSQRITLADFTAQYRGQQSRINTASGAGRDFI